MRNTIQLLRWSGTVLSPRTRRNPRLCLFSNQPRRTAATATAEASESDTNPRPKQTSETATAVAPEIIIKPGRSRPIRPSPYQKFPSPPPEASRNSARLAALHARLYLSPRIPLETLGRCLIDSTADLNPSFNNNSLSLLGNDILNYHASELILCRYPRLPSAIILAAMTALIGPAALTDLSKSWGVEAAAVPGGEVDPGLLQFTNRKAGNSESTPGTGRLEKEDQPASNGFKRGVSAIMRRDDYFGEITGQEVLTPVAVDDSPTKPIPAGLSSTYQGASTNFVRALFGAIYIHSGRLSAKNFFTAHITSRKLDVSKLFVFKAPERDLAALCAREGFEAPIARMISETGRLSIAPVFNVGVFSGKEKLGEATGASLQEARFRAAVAALKGWYLYSPLEVRVPSDVEGGSGGGGANGAGKPWEPVLIDGGEVVW